VRLPDAPPAESDRVELADDEDAELPDIDIEIAELRPPPLTEEPPTSITPLPPLGATVPLETIAWPKEPRAGRWSRALVTAAVALGILGAAVAAAMHHHFG